MTARPAKFVDTDRIVELLEEMHARSKFASFTTPNTKEARSVVMQIIQKSPRFACSFVTESNGVVEGMILGCVQRLYEATEELFATDVYFYVSERSQAMDAFELLKAYEGWAEANPRVVLIRNAVMDGITDWKPVGRILEGFGYELVGGVYEKRTSSARSAA